MSRVSGTSWESHTCELAQDTAQFGENQADFCLGTLPIFQLQQLDNLKDCFQKKRRICVKKMI